MMEMKILLADDQVYVRSALRLILEHEPAWKIIGEAVEASSLWTTIQSCCPDVVLLDWELPGLDQAEDISKMRDYCPDIKVVALSSQVDSRKSAQRARVDAFVSKGDPPEAIINALQSIAKSTLQATNIDHKRE